MLCEQTKIGEDWVPAKYLQLLTRKFTKNGRLTLEFICWPK